MLETWCRLPGSIPIVNKRGKWDCYDQACQGQGNQTEWLGYSGGIKIWEDVEGIISNYVLNVGTVENE